MHKAIPASRDRLQSMLLNILIGIPIHALSGLLIVFSTLRYERHHMDVFELKSLGIALTFGILVWALKAATFPAALMGSSICFLITVTTDNTQGSPFRSGLGPLIALFAFTFLATRLGRRKKEAAGLAEPRKGRRTSQVLANLGPSVVMLTLCTFNALDFLKHRLGVFNFSTYVMPTVLLATLCAATADTISAEIGQAFGGTPILLTTFRKVPPGTDGAITLIGTTAGILAATIVAAVGLFSLQHLPLIGLTSTQAAIALTAATCGLILDTLLGATVERKGWLGNDLVNFTSTLTAGLAAAILLAL